jgi:hypothetical protein
MVAIAASFLVSYVASMAGRACCRAMGSFDPSMVRVRYQARSVDHPEPSDRGGKQESGAVTGRITHPRDHVLRKERAGEVAVGLPDSDGCRDHAHGAGGVIPCDTCTDLRVHRGGDALGEHRMPQRAGVRCDDVDHAPIMAIPHPSVML